MAKTIAEVRAFNRERRSRQRAAARAAGVPPPPQVHAALAEASAFAMRAGVNIEGRRLLIDSGLMMTTAVEILVHRAGYDLQRSREAVARIVAPRPEHVWPNFVPSHTKTTLGAGIGM